MPRARWGHACRRHGSRRKAPAIGTLCRTVTSGRRSAPGARPRALAAASCPIADRTLPACAARATAVHARTLTRARGCACNVTASSGCTPPVQGAGAGCSMESVEGSPSEMEGSFKGSPSEMEGSFKVCEMGLRVHHVSAWAPAPHIHMWACARMWRKALSSARTSPTKPHADTLVSAVLLWRVVQCTGTGTPTFAYARAHTRTRAHT